MKVVPLQDRGNFKAVDVIRQIVKAPGREGINYDEMNKRCRVLDALDAAEKNSKTVLELEDADYQTLAGTLKGFQFAVADRDLLAILDEIKNAKAPVKTD